MPKTARLRARLRMLTGRLSIHYRATPAREWDPFEEGRSAPAFLCWGYWMAIVAVWLTSPALNPKVIGTALPVGALAGTVTLI